jgi:adenosylcobinamide kinase/adenosylcobinamide-phosphate guanylyltransferase
MSQIEHLLLVLGGTRSGKSSYAVEAAARAAGENVSYLATARTGDPELDARIAAPRRERPSAWLTQEVGLDLAAAIDGPSLDRFLLIDSLTLWVASLLEAGEVVADRWSAAAAAIASRRGRVIVVSDEVGLGIVPDTSMGRRFRDELGWVNQQVAATAGTVVLLVAGVPIPLRTGTSWQAR